MADHGSLSARTAAREQRLDKPPNPPSPTFSDSSIAAFAEVFNAAIRDYARVIQGQIVSAKTLGEAIAITGLDGASDLLASLQTEAQRFTATTEAHTLSLIAELQRHDKLRQMLDKVAHMAGEIGRLDLNLIVRSPEGADQPLRIVLAAADTYVAAEQRITHLAALNQGTTSTGPDLELF